MEGNQMKMRETLNDIIRIAKIALNVNSFENSNDSELWNIIDKCKSALSAPPRQCDVGTPEEQYRRWVHFCEQRLHRCDNCPCNRPEGCTFTYENMPYAEEGGAE